MNALEDELDLRYHRGLKPDVYYRCPTLESLDGALRNELQKSADSFIPVEVVTEFVFGAASIITIPVTQQPNLVELIQPANVPQSITVDLSLCRDIESKERLKVQRAVARSIIETIQEIDGFKYAERQAFNKEATGVRFKYVCIDSLQNRDRKSNAKKEQKVGEDDDEEPKKSSSRLPTYDCGGAIHLKFSTKREALNVVYKHNPIHRDIGSRATNGDSHTQEGADASNQIRATSSKKRARSSNDISPKKKRRSKKHQEEAQDSSNGVFHDPDLDMSTSPEASRGPTKRNRRSKVAASPEQTKSSSKKKQGKAKEAQSPAKSRTKKASVPEPEPEPIIPKIFKPGACVRCREKKIKCNEAKPTCNQCNRGLWTCQYQEKIIHKRSKNGCFNCKQRRRKCTEEQPSCAYCLKIDDECEYPNED